MTVAQFFHVCRSAAAIADVAELTAFGAAAVIPWMADAADVQPWASLEVDIDPGTPDKADLVDGSIGEGSLFSETFGVFAHGVGLEAFVAPADWPSRARVFHDPVSGVAVRVPHPSDLVVAKLVRGDPRDWAFADYVWQHSAVTKAQITAGLDAAARARPEYASAAAAARVLADGRTWPERHEPLLP